MTPVSQNVALICRALARRPEPRWRIWVLAHKEHPQITIVEVIDAIESALRDGSIYEHDSLLYLNRHRKFPVE